MSGVMSHTEDTMGNKFLFVDLKNEIELSPREVTNIEFPVRDIPAG